jgi:hypothetical protein
MKNPMDPQHLFQKDDAGSIIAKPMVGVALMPIGGLNILLQIRYANSPEELGKKDSILQVSLTPQQGQNLAEALTRQANNLLNPPDTVTRQ